MKPRILVFVRHYLPGYRSGGPIRTIANLVAHLGHEIDFNIVTSDRDATDTRPYAGVAVDEWNTVGKADVLYLSPARRSLGNLVKVIRDSRCDAIYLNSFFDPDFTLKPLLARRLGLIPRLPAIVAPRGEFGDSALALKAARKRAYLVAARAAGLYSGVIWQASSDRELQDIVERFGVNRGRISTAVDLPAPSDGIHGPRSAFCKHRRDTLAVCFLSRISPMKNLDFALAVLSRVTARVAFDIWGPVRDSAYWADCQSLMASLPDNVAARYKGSVDHEQVMQTLAGYDLFFLPTRGENYGHAILEALTAGTPVLIADTTPWRDLAAHGVGWDLPLDDEQSFVNRIEWMANADQDSSRGMREQASSFAARLIRDEEAIEANREMFLNVCRPAHESHA